MNAHGASEVINRAANTVDDPILKAIRGAVYPAGTVVFPKVGGALLTNKKRVLGVRAAFDNNIMGLVPHDGLLSKYLLLWMETFDLAELANTQALPSLRKSDIARVEIALPDPPEKQQEVVTKLETAIGSVSSVCEAATRQFEAISALPAATLREFFNFGGQANG